MTSIRLVAFPLFLSLFPVACVTSPGNNGHVENTADPVAFSGVGLSPGRRVTLEASSSPRGPFAIVPGANAMTSARASTSVTLPRGASVSLYPFSLTSAIPKERWSPFSTAGCSRAETFVRIREGSTSYLTFDADNTGIACIQERVDHGQSPDQALLACRSSESPVLRLEQGGFVHPGDAVIASDADLAALRCVHTIRGSLTVAATAPTVIALPLLQRVMGDVNLAYTSYPLDPAPMSGEIEVMRCGALRRIAAEVRAFDLPALTTIDGDLSIEQQGSFSRSASTQPIDLRLNTLTTVGGNLSIVIHQLGGSPCGLSALTRVTGDLTIDFVVGAEVDNSASGLLGALVSVGGTLGILNSHNSYGTPLSSLRSAGGLRVVKVPNTGGFSLPALTDVAGVVELVNTHRFSNPIALATAGTLIVRNSRYDSLEQVGGPRLAVGNLELHDNALLTALTSSGASKVTLAPAARLRLANNPLVPDAEICAFVALQRRLGWTGPRDLDGTTCP